jgi:hypothetical protein
LDHENDAFRPRHQRIIETCVERAIASQRPANADHRHNQRRGAQNEERDLAAGAGEQRLNPLTAEITTERHGYFSFGASAKR